MAYRPSGCSATPDVAPGTQARSGSALRLGPPGGSGPGGPAAGGGGGSHRTHRGRARRDRLRSRRRGPSLPGGRSGSGSGPMRPVRPTGRTPVSPKPWLGGGPALTRPERRRNPNGRGWLDGRGGRGFGSGPRGKSGLHGATVPGNARPARAEGQRHREQTAAPQGAARVKRWGKSPPRTGRPGRHGKPHREQRRIGISHGPRSGPGSGLAARAVGATRRPDEWPSRGPSRPPGQNPAYRPPACSARGQRSAVARSRTHRVRSGAPSPELTAGRPTVETPLISLTGGPAVPRRARAWPNRPPSRSA